MKKILQQWLARLAASKAATPDGREFDPDQPAVRRGVSSFSVSLL